MATITIKNKELYTITAELEELDVKMGELVDKAAKYQEKIRKLEAKGEKITNKKIGLLPKQIELIKPYIEGDVLGEYDTVRDATCDKMTDDNVNVKIVDHLEEWKPQIKKKADKLNEPFFKEEEPTEE